MYDMVMKNEVSLTPCKSYSKMGRDHRHQLIHDFPFHEKKPKMWLQYELANLGPKRCTNDYKWIPKEKRNTWVAST